MLAFDMKLVSNPWDLYQNMDSEVIKHCENVAQYVKILYELALKADLYPGKLTKEQLALVRSAVVYHDIGKSRISLRILNKKGPLTKFERKQVEKHVYYGEDIFGEMVGNHYVSYESELFLETALQAISQHHERIDGSGYPRGLAGEEISLIGRMTSICDFYDALISARPYHAARSGEEVVAMMKNESGRMFDSLLVELFRANHNRFEEVGKNTSEQVGGKRIAYKKKQPVEIICREWSELPEEIGEDTCIDVTEVFEDEVVKTCCIKVCKQKSLIVKGNSHQKYRNLQFQLEGGNLLLLQDVRINGGSLPVLIIGGKDCWIILEGKCEMDSEYAFSPVYLKGDFSGLKINFLNRTHKRVAAQGG